ncbi:hypothetical protein [Methylocaldum sp.]|uniref:hypothetical protein n=1 Tax=Methylocaldum sp. TaxID=1969727 RepID=UPI002D5F116A|nr:hypothetical protein [Methylocaldum sp.]HYE36888.1 hypothetical protein [Methylocaldum sp.]
MNFEIPNDFFDPLPNRDERWPNHPELRRAVNWLKSFMSEKDWIKRREVATRRLYAAAIGLLNDPTGKGRIFSENDTFGWYLFLAEACLDHFWNYEPVFGSRVVPLLMAIGRDLPLLESIPGLNARVCKMVGADRRQPNGCLFELLVAAAYRRCGAKVEFVEEKPGKKRTHDMNIELDGQIWAVECKRMETGEYGERERTRMRKLWGPSAAFFRREEKSVFCDVHFTVEIDAVPADYLTRKAKQWLESSLSSFSWNDEIGNGLIRNLDLSPLRTVLTNEYVLGGSSKVFELLTGQYMRNASYISTLKIEPAENPRYINDCSLAILLRWESMSPASIKGRARDILNKLSEATEQLPDNVPSIVHIGFEAVEGDRVEKARHEKILATARRFNPGSKSLEYIYCHYFVPESPPDQAWNYEETTQWCAIKPSRPRPLREHHLVLPPSATESRPGPHWQD